jgi:hypothetical protein
MATPSSEDFKYTGFFAGVVTHNNDPLMASRIRLKVEGLLEPHSGWAWPFAMPGGGDTQSGSYNVPKVGAEVLVMFLGGDPDYPRWTYGSWGTPNGVSDIPEPARTILAEDGPEAAQLIKAYEDDRFQIFTDMREEKGRFMIRSKRQDGEDLSGPALAIEMDDEAGTLSLSAPTGININTLGAVTINGLIVSMNDRMVANVPKAI